MSMNPLNNGITYETIKFHELQEFMCLIEELIQGNDNDVVIITQQDEFFEIVCLAATLHFFYWDEWGWWANQTELSLECGYGNHEAILISKKENKYVLYSEQRTNNTNVASNIVYLTIEDD